MTYARLPPIWLIVLIIGLPKLSETVYSPSLPAIAHSLHTSASLIEYTLTIYLLGFALGTLFWGKLSDQYGRKPCILAGLGLYILGCLGCYNSTDITMLMASRLLQAFGASVGSVLGQALCRDAFHGIMLAKVYSVAVTALSVFPAIGPLIGGLITQHYSWPDIFLFLMTCTLILWLIIIVMLPETHSAKNRKSINMTSVALNLLRNKKVIGFSFIVGACNGLSFSYYAEGSFYLIKLLGLSPGLYGASFIFIAAAAMLGGMLSKRMNSSYSSLSILNYGLIIIALTSIAFAGCIFIHYEYIELPNWFIIGLTIINQMNIVFGVSMAGSNALALALLDYKECIGTASSLFGFFYYCLISMFTLGIGYLHDGTILPMPFYFLAISLSMLLIQRKLIHT